MGTVIRYSDGYYENTYDPLKLQQLFSWTPPNLVEYELSPENESTLLRVSMNTNMQEDENNPKKLDYTLHY